VETCLRRNQKKKKKKKKKRKEKTDETTEERRIRWTPLSSSLFLDRKRSRRPTQWEEKNKKSCAKQF
jgi:hypothetical protein